jgi:hypothetical protein
MNDQPFDHRFNPFAVSHVELIDPSPPPAPLRTGRACPFCSSKSSGRQCAGCGRDVTAPRKICGSCRRTTPSQDRYCCHCRARQHSELSWKLPLIVLAFAVIFLLNVAIALYG